MPYLGRIPLLAASVLGECAHVLGKGAEQIVLNAARHNDCRNAAFSSGRQYAVAKSPQGLYVLALISASLRLFRLLSVKVFV
jgi:hypothetical protein